MESLLVVGIVLVVDVVLVVAVVQVAGVVQDICQQPLVQVGGK